MELNTHQYCPRCNLFVRSMFTIRLSEGAQLIGRLEGYTSGGCPKCHGDTFVLPTAYDPETHTITYLDNSFPTRGDFEKLAAIYKQAIAEFWDDERLSQEFTRELPNLGVFARLLPTSAAGRAAYLALILTFLSQGHSLPTTPVLVDPVAIRTPAVPSVVVKAPSEPVDPRSSTAPVREISPQNREFSLRANTVLGIPIYCLKCARQFTMNSAPGIGGASVIEITSVTIACPKCTEEQLVPDGVYAIVDGAISFVRIPYSITPSDWRSYDRIIKRSTLERWTAERLRQVIRNRFPRMILVEKVHQIRGTPLPGQPDK